MTTLLLVVPLASVVAGGEPVRAQQSVGPALILEDSVVLQETRDAYVGQPVEMFLGNDGSLFVVDGFSNSVVRFDQSGRLVGTYGRQGQGPGEFSYIGFGGFAQEILGVVDGRPPRQEIEFFDVESGRHLGRAATSDMVTAVTAHGGKLWVGGVNTDEWKGLGVKPLRALPGGEIRWTASRFPSRTRRANCFCGLAEALGCMPATRTSLSDTWQVRF